MENFHRDEPFHLNSPRNFRVFHTNGKRSRFDQMFFFSTQSKSRRCGYCREFSQHLILTPFDRAFLVSRNSAYIWLKRVHAVLHKTLSASKMLVFDWLTKNRRYLIRKIFAAIIDWR